MKNGIDISYYQNKVDYKALAKVVDFVIIRVGRWLRDRDEPYKDSLFEEHYKQCKANGIPVGAFWYCYADNPQRAEEEAEWCYEWIKNKQFEYPIFFDIEEKYQAQRGNCSDICKAFLEPLEKKNYWVGIYSYNSFIENNLDDTVRNKYSLWIARTPKEDNGYTKIAPSRHCFMHQWTFKNHNDAIPVNSKDIDRDICFMDNVPEIMKQKGLNGFNTVDVTERKQEKIKVYNVVVDEFSKYEDARVVLKHIQADYPKAKIKTTTKTILKG